MKYTICMFCGSSLPHITSLTNWSIIGDKKTQQSLDYSIQMFIPFSWFQGKLLFSLKKLSSSLFDDTDWFQWKSIPFKVQTRLPQSPWLKSLFIASLKLLCHWHHMASHKSAVSYFLIILRHLFNWFCLDVTDVQMSPMSWCHRCLDVSELRISPRCPVFPPQRLRCH